MEVETNTQSYEWQEGALLVLTNHDALRTEIERRLREKNRQNVLFAASLQEAEQRLNDSEIEMILIEDTFHQDYSYKFLFELRRVTCSTHLPVLLIVNEVEEKKLPAAFEQGVTDFITTPIDTADFSARIHIGLQLRKNSQKLLDTIRSLKHRVMKDPVTGVYNRCGMMELGLQLLDTALMKDTDFSLILCDVDGFKGVNDSHGHVFGDAILHRLGSFLNEQVRRSDIVARYGGDEFVVILPGTSAADAQLLAERILQKVETLPVVVEEKTVNVTLSIGVATLQTASLSKRSLESMFNALIAQADMQMYMAKAEGKNCVSCTCSPAGV